MSNQKNIFCFGGTHPTAVNLVHLAYMYIDKDNAKRIVFVFHHAPLYVDLPDEQEAKLCFEKLLTAWVGDVVGTEQKA